MNIDLSKCKKGDKLRIRTTEAWLSAFPNPPTDIVTFIGENDGHATPFIYDIEYSDGSGGSRTKEGWTYFNNRLPDDPDVIEIIGQD